MGEACQGRGTLQVHPCSAWRGSGQVEKEELLSVTIPVGVEEGLALRIPGKGMPSAEVGGQAGDLFAVVRVTVPPGTQSGAMLRIIQKGLPAFGGVSRGDLYLRIGVHIPEQLTRRQRELYLKLRALDDKPGVA